ncbi:MAG: hypothetical protein WAU05_05415, partial [Nitrospira sp.]
GVCFVGLSLELDSSRRTFAIVLDPRFGEGYFVQEGETLAERIEIARIRWLQLISKYSEGNST